MVLVRRLLAAASIAAMAVGCSFEAGVQYQPTTPPDAPTAAAVDLKVVDARPADQRGENGARVGSVRNGYGMPFPIYESSADRVEKLVAEATRDALRRAHVAARPGGSRVLVATIRAFWLDGYAGYKSFVEVDYTLTDRGGAQLWASSVKGASGGVQWFGVSGMANELLARALTDCATRAGDEFSSPAFQRQVF